MIVRLSFWLNSVYGITMLKYTIDSKKVTILLSILTTLLLISTLVMTTMVLIFEKLYFSILNREMVILPGRQMYEIWRNIAIPIYLKVHIFNVTNVDEILRGGKPRLNEVGPFVYLENRTFGSISFSEENPPKTVNFLEYRRYIFQPQLSVADPKQVTVTIPDLFFGSIIGHIGRTVLTEQSPFVSLSAHSATWETKMPRGFSDRLRVGFFAQQNDSIPVHVKLKTGADDVNNVGRVVAINGKRYHEIWGAEEADRIDGIQWIRVMPDPRFGSTIDFQMPELCRKMILTANETVPSSVVPELTLMKFVAPEAADMDSTKHWNNRMYCQEDKACTPQGILAMQPCIAKRGVTVPIYVSFPHFMDADPRISARFEGLPKPSKEKHGIHLLVEPNTGIVLEAYVRFQLNLFMANKHDERYKNMAGPYYFPIAWVEGNIMSPKNLVQLLKSVAIDVRTKVPFILSVLAIVCGIASFALIIILVIRGRIHRFRNNAQKTLQMTRLGDPGKPTFPHAHQSDPKPGETLPVVT